MDFFQHTIADCCNQDHTLLISVMIHWFKWSLCTLNADVDLIDESISCNNIQQLLKAWCLSVPERHVQQQMRSLDPIICSTTYMINCDRPCTQTNFTSQSFIKTGISVIIFSAIWVNFLGCNISKEMVSTHFFLGCNISKQMVSTLGTIVLLKLKNKNQLKTNTNGTGSMQTRVYLTTR